MDFVATGTKLRVLTIVDTFSCFSPVVESEMKPLCAGDELTLVIHRASS
jgi:hypothetical protein